MIAKHHTLACLTIDDPLLKPAYGCFDYETLLREMKEHRFFTEIAFIPYNWKRSDARTVRLFLDNPDYLGICVHGCNHGRHEFGSGSFEELSELAAIALQRMRKHEELTGLRFDPVMVFPQSRFCKSAVRALKGQGYLAAFNSSLRPTGGEDPPAYEFKRPVTYFHDNFPMFLRRKHDDRVGIQKDLDVGRPGVLALHHDDFCDGYQKITDSIDWINSQGDVRWTNLSEIAIRYAERDISNSCGPELRTSELSEQTGLGLAVRRMLCEARDNCVDTNPLLRKTYQKIRRLLPK